MLAPQSSTAHNSVCSRARAVCLCAVQVLPNEPMCRALETARQLSSPTERRCSVSCRDPPAMESQSDFRVLTAGVFVPAGSVVSCSAPLPPGPALRVGWCVNRVSCARVRGFCFRHSGSLCLCLCLLVSSIGCARIRIRGPSTRTLASARESGLLRSTDPIQREDYTAHSHKVRI